MAALEMPLRTSSRYPVYIAAGTPGRVTEMSPTLKESDSGNARRATLIHVARVAGVGLGTASRVFNQSPNVSAETIRRVHEAADLLGYQRNAVARNLRMRRSGAIGIIVPHIGGPFMDDCVRAALAVIRAQKYVSVLAFSSDDRETEVEEIEYLLQRQIDGILIVPAEGGSTNQMDSRLLNGTPVVAFDQPLSWLKTDEVLVSNRSGAESATRHLIEHGHKRITCVKISRDVYTLHTRLEGYRRAMRSAKLKPDIANLGPSGDGALEVVDGWLNSENPPTAIFTVNEITSIEILLALASRNVQIPQQLAVVAFDDVQLGPLLRAPLTAVRQPAAEIGHLGATLLMKRVVEKSTDAPRRTLLNTELVLRESCGCQRP
jgi:LacI family transcriptional regulator